MTDKTAALASRACVPCSGGVPLLTSAESGELLQQLEGWQIVDGHHLTKEYRFRDFVEALSFVNRVGEVAEQNGHHPDIWLGWGRVQIELYTHKVNGLTESDFVVASKCDRVLPTPP